jgi:hypothetical protein
MDATSLLFAPPLTKLKTKFVDKDSKKIYPPVFPLGGYTDDGIGSSEIDLLREPQTIVFAWIASHDPGQATHCTLITQQLAVLEVIAKTPSSNKRAYVAMAISFHAAAWESCLGAQRR